LSTNSEDQNTHVLLSLWFDCREWTKLGRERHTRLAELLENYKDLTFFVTDYDLGFTQVELLRLIHGELQDGIIKGMTGKEMDLHVKACFLKVQLACFDQLCLLVYEPFTNTPAYGSLFLLIGDPDSWVTPYSFEYGRAISSGSYGAVVSCVKKSTGVVYAMKIQPKSTLLRLYRRDKRRVMTEMHAYAICDHPYVTKLCYAMQSESLTMLVMPISKCGDLGRSLLFTECGHFSPERVQFYCAEIVSALFYLHNFGLIYRDLKLGNVLLNADGHITLADFGTLADLNGILNDQFLGAADTSTCCRDVAHLKTRRKSASKSANNSFHKHYPSDQTTGTGMNSPLDGAELSENKKMRSKSVVGTVEYMAPEIICMFGNQQVSHNLDGYTAAVDYWSLGVIIYHMSTGSVPFRRVHAAQLTAQLPSLLAQRTDTYENIFHRLFGEVDYSHRNLSATAADLIRGLLVFVPEQRLGTNSLHQVVAACDCHVRTHGFFAGVNWADIETKSVKPPFVPVHEAVGGSIQDNDRGEFPCLTGLFEHMNKKEWIDVELYHAYTPPARTVFSDMMGTMRDNVMNSIRSRANGQTDSKSRIETDEGGAISSYAKIKEARRSVEVEDQDQGHFFGWNYVSNDLLEVSTSETHVDSPT